MPDLYLLCHPTELHKPSNTGQLLPGLLPLNSGSSFRQPLPEATSNQIEDPAGVAGQLLWRSYQVLWQRKQPAPQLLAALQRGGAVLLYPSAHAAQIDLDMPLSLTAADGEPLRSVILLDATWQLAQKMFNQSPYLHDLPHWRAISQYQSVFMLRRNQRAGAWCTAETVALLWQASGASAQAAALWQQFYRFNQR